MKKMIYLLPLLMMSTSAFAADDMSNATAMKAAAYFIAMAIAAFGGTAAQSRAASVALEGIARNPSAAAKIQTPMILGLALWNHL